MSESVARCKSLYTCLGEALKQIEQMREMDDMGAGEEEEVFRDLLKKRVAAHTVKAKKKFGEEDEAHRMRPEEMNQFVEQLSAIYRETGVRAKSPT